MSKTNIKPTPDDERIAESKKNAKAAGKKQAAKKLDRAAKKLADKAVLEIAADLPAGQGNAFVQLHAEHRKAEEAIAAGQKWKRTVRAKMKGIKVDMSCYDRVNKLSKMEPADVTAKKATEALYEQQLAMPLSPEQQKIVDGINAKRADAREAMPEMGTGDAGKEIGSGGPIGHNSNPQGNATAPIVPPRNDAIRKGFQHPAKDAAAVTH